MEVFDCLQGSEEWFAARLGKVTASCFSDVLCKGSGRKTYMMELVAERLTGERQKGYCDKNMQDGSDKESDARVFYESLNDLPVQQVGFVALNDNVGCSPDGLVGEDGLIEIKCPLASTHIVTLLKGKMSTTYTPQVQGQLWVTGRKWCDYVSFAPQMKQRPFYCTRVFRDDKYIKVIEMAVEQFVTELNELISKVINQTPF
jgi:hypothetical protein